MSYQSWNNAVEELNEMLGGSFSTASMMSVAMWHVCAKLNLTNPDLEGS